MAVNCGHRSGSREWSWMHASGPSPFGAAPPEPTPEEIEAAERFVAAEREASERAWIAATVEVQAYYHPGFPGMHAIRFDPEGIIPRGQTTLRVCRVYAEYLKTTTREWAIVGGGLIRVSDLSA